MVRGWLVAALVVLVGCGCGGGDEELARRAAAEAEPVVARFLGDVHEGRTDLARALMTEEFRAAAEPARLEQVRRSLVEVLGAPGERRFREARDVEPLPAPAGEPAAAAATLVYDARYARGAATVELRLERSAPSADAWRVGGLLVRGPAFEWDFR